jgi:hypothetical protein
MMREKGGEVGEASRAHVEDLGGDRTLAEPACARRNLAQKGTDSVGVGTLFSLWFRCGCGTYRRRQPEPTLAAKGQQACLWAAAIVATAACEAHTSQGHGSLHGRPRVTG